MPIISLEDEYAQVRAMVLESRTFINWHTANRLCHENPLDRTILILDQWTLNKCQETNMPRPKLGYLISPHFGYCLGITYPNWKTNGIITESWPICTNPMLKNIINILRSRTTKILQYISVEKNKLLTFQLFPFFDICNLD